MRRFCACVLLALAASPAAAQVELRWKWKQDATFYVQTVTRVKQTLVIEDPRGETIKLDRPARDLACLGLVGGLPGGSLVALSMLIGRDPDFDREVRQDYEHTSWVRYTVQKSNDDGSAVLAQRVESERGSVKGPEGVKADSILDGIELTLHVDARGEVTKVEGGAKLLERLAGTETGKREALAAALSDDTLKASASAMLGLFPGKTVKPGDSWPRPIELNLGGLGRLRLERTFTLERIEDKPVKLARVNVATRLAGYEPGRGAGVAYRVEHAHWTAAEGKGKLAIDLSAGRPAEAQNSVNLVGYLTLLNNQVRYLARLVQEQTVTVKVHEKLPAE